MAVTAPPVETDPAAGKGSGRGKGPAKDVAGLGMARALGFVSPAFALIGAFLVFPAIWTLYIGLTNYRLTGPQAENPQNVGIQNYVDAVNDPNFGNSLLLSGIFVLGSAIVGQNILGFFLAWSLQGAKPWVKRLTEGLVLVAWILPAPVVAILWVALLDRSDGALNQLIGGSFPWLLEYPMLSLVIFNTWRGTAFSMLLYTSALTSVPPSQLETARMAGSSSWQTLRDVVFPHVRGHILTNTLLISLWTANDFSPYLITGGGPNRASETLPVFIYNEALGGGQLGYASAISLLLMIANLLVSLVYLRLLRKRS